MNPQIALTPRQQWLIFAVSLLISLEFGLFLFYRPFGDAPPFRIILLVWVPAMLPIAVVGGLHGGTTTEQIVGGLLGGVLNAALYAWGLRLLARRLLRRSNPVSVEAVCLMALSLSALFAAILTGAGIWLALKVSAAYRGAAYELSVAGFCALVGAVALGITLRRRADCRLHGQSPD